jgi:hypothetical protein
LQSEVSFSYGKAQAEEAPARLPEALDASRAQQIINVIASLPKAQQEAKMQELAKKYGVGLKKILGANVAFDIIDNTDDHEPTKATISDMLNSQSSGLKGLSHFQSVGGRGPRSSHESPGGSLPQLKGKLLNKDSRNNGFQSQDHVGEG